MNTDIVFVLDVKCTYMKIVFLYLNNYRIILFIIMRVYIYFFYCVHDVSCFNAQ